MTAQLQKEGEGIQGPLRVDLVPRTKIREELDFFHHRPSHQWDLNSHGRPESKVNFSFRAGKTVAAPRLSEKEKLPGHRSTAETTCLQKMSPRHPQVTEQTAACESSWTRCQVPKRGCRESHEFNGHAGKSRHPPSQH